MAKSVNNPLTKGLSGMVGRQLVFRSWNGKTYISAAPKKPSKQSPLQKENRSKFKKATAFAKAMMKDPLKKAEYKEIAVKLKLPNAYTAAITEYMRNPEVVELDSTAYSGNAGEEIKVTARKKGFDLKQVEVSLINKDGLVIEQGTASKGANSLWIYTTKTSQPPDQLLLFIIKATDQAGNYGEKRCDKEYSKP